ncbi:MAG TPA: serine/threonine-protein kinase [Kofleriaceae bacterium]
MVEGTQVGAYRLIQRIGEGGMGVVWMAEHSMLGRRAAVKVLHPSFSMQPAIVQRFFNEARAATAISDPGIVQIFDFGNHTDGSAYIVMELLDGEPLDRRLHAQGVMAVGEALRILRQVASSLGAAHARGIIHRDLKPENIFLVRDPEVPGGIRAKILDFGIAKLTGDASAAKTNTQAVMGTPAYMSPEQCRGAGLVDARSDVYALGCVLMTLITGRQPFEGEGVGELIVGHMQLPPPVPSSRVPTIPPTVDQLVLRCLAKDPSHRYANASELANAVGALVTQPTLDTVPRNASAPTIAAYPQPTTLSSVAAQVTSTTGIPGRKKSGLVYAGLAVTVIAGAATVIALKSSSNAESSGEAPAPAAAPAPAPVAATPTPPAPEPPKPAPPVDERPATTQKQIASAAQAFVTWAASHAGAACPKLEDVAGKSIDDGWGKPLSLTCTDQPADQIVGIVSVGADGAVGTADDVASWSVDAAKVALKGARWAPKAVATSRPVDRARQPKPKTKPATTKPGTGVPGDLDGDGLPDHR